MVYQTCPSCFCGAIDAFSYISWIMLCSVFSAYLGSLSPCMNGGVKASTGFSCGAHTHKKNTNSFPWITTEVGKF
jgi:hypothetical protein